MASPPPNPDTRQLPYGWIEQYNWEYKQWFYVNTREQPPRSSWDHPIGLMPQGFGAPPGPPPSDRSYSRSPYGGPPPPQQGFGGYQGYQQQPYGQSRGPPQGYYNAPSGGFGPPAYDNRSWPQERVAYEEPKQQKKGPGIGTALLSGIGGAAAGAFLMNAIEHHDEREREEGYEEGFGEGFGDGYNDGFTDGYVDGGDGW